MHYEPLNESNYILYCAKNHDGRYFTTTEEFYDDLKRVAYIRKLITRYIETGDLRERLILNHIIVLNNLFGPVATCRILFFKLADQLQYIKPFLVMLNILPEKVFYVGEQEVIDTDYIAMDPTIVDALRKI